MVPAAAVALSTGGGSEWTCACRILIQPGHATSRSSWMMPSRTSLRR